MSAVAYATGYAGIAAPNQKKFAEWVRIGQENSSKEYIGDLESATRKFMERLAKYEEERDEKIAAAHKKYREDTVSIVRAENAAWELYEKKREVATTTYDARRLAAVQNNTRRVEALVMMLNFFGVKA